MSKRSRTEDSTPISPGGEPHQDLADRELVVNRGWQLPGGQKGASVAMEERLLFSITVMIGIVMLVAFTYWVYAVSLMAF